MPGEAGVAAQAAELAEFVRRVAALQRVGLGAVAAARRPVTGSGS